MFDFHCTKFIAFIKFVSEFVAWFCGNGSKVTLCQAWLVLRWVTVCRILSYYLTSHPAQLSILPLVGWVVSIGHSDAMWL